MHGVIAPGFCERHPVGLVILNRTKSSQEKASATVFWMPWCAQFWDHAPWVVASTNRHGLRVTQGHLEWGSYDHCRSWSSVPTACLRTIQVSPLWPVVQFWSHFSTVAFLSVSSEELYWPVTLSNNCTKLFRQGVNVNFKFLGIIRVGQDYISWDCSL